MQSRRHRQPHTTPQADIKSEEWPRAVVWGGVEERVEVERSWIEERDGRRAARYRLGLEDGTTIEISKADDERDWRLERELS
ncbi:MAG: hypothetical protein ACXVP3_06610 [Actinomycetota bacterium]